MFRFLIIFLLTLTLFIGILCFIAKNIENISVLRLRFVAYFVVYGDDLYSLGGILGVLSCVSGARHSKINRANQTNAKNIFARVKSAFSALSFAPAFA